LRSILKIDKNAFKTVKWAIIPKKAPWCHRKVGMAIKKEMGIAKKGLGCYEKVQVLIKKAQE